MTIAVFLGSELALPEGACLPSRNLRSGVIFFLFFFCFFASLARERHKELTGRGHDLRLPFLLLPSFAFVGCTVVSFLEVGLSVA